MMLIAAPVYAAEAEATDPDTQPEEPGDVHRYRNVGTGTRAAE